MTPRQRKQLRARAHALKPVVLVGTAGISEPVVAETDRALEAHELIKIRLPAAGREERARLARELCLAVGAEDVQAIGRIRVLFRVRRHDAGSTRQG
jgi:putative YhbY family RNA-binding protein